MVHSVFRWKCVRGHDDARDRPYTQQHAGACNAKAAVHQIVPCLRQFTPFTCCKGVLLVDDVLSSVAMMLQDFGMMDEANDIYRSVEETISSGYVTNDLDKSKNYKCSEVGAHIVTQLLQESTISLS